MGVRLRSFRQQIARIKRRIERAIPTSLNRSGEKTVQTIVDRTSRGVSSTGGRFKRYSREYADYRAKKGRSSTPDLNFSGRMLSNLGVERKNRNTVKVAFSRNEEKNKARQNQKTRPFIGVRAEEVKFITDAFRRQFERDIR